jgi:hypothetical protein
MGFSVFSSKPTWASSHAKSLTRTDVETVAQVHEVVDDLKRQGCVIHSVEPVEVVRRSRSRRHS